MRAWIVLALLVGAGVFLFLRGGSDVLSGLSTGEIVTAAAGLLLATIYIISLFNDERTRPMQAVRYILAWLAIGFGLIAGYSYRGELSGVAHRVMGELSPSGEILSVETNEDGERAVRVRRRLDGHFAVRASVNGQSMTLMVDTGASSVVLKPGGRGAGRRRPQKAVLHGRRRDSERHGLRGGGPTAHARRRPSRHAQRRRPRRPTRKH